MSDRVWMLHEGTEYEWSDAADNWTGNARPLTEERRQELEQLRLHAEDIARSWGWNGEHDPNKFAILNTEKVP